jgi:hypothetical protein
MFGVIILLSTSSEVKQIQQYRLIGPLNVSFRIFTKVATNRITKFTQKMVRPAQIAFLPGRNIMEGAIVLHGTIHELHKKKLNGFFFENLTS